MIKDFFVKKMLEAKMKNLSKEDREKVLDTFNKNPELFNKIGQEVQDKMKGGKDQMTAVMEVVKKYENELKGII